MINQTALGGCSGPSLEDVIAGPSGPWRSVPLLGGGGSVPGCRPAARPSHPVWVALRSSPGRLAGLPGHLGLEEGGCQDTLGSPDPTLTPPPPPRPAAPLPGLFPYSPTGQACSCSMAPSCSRNKTSALEATPALPISCTQLLWSLPPSPLHAHTCAPQFTTLCGSRDPPYPSRMQFKAWHLSPFTE